MAGKLEVECGNKMKNCIENMDSTQQEKQVISRRRVNDHGEVYTAKREVNAMIDLVKQETERIESRFLEPACGTGNFLAEVLDRKIRVVENRYGKSQLEYERYSFIAVTSIYGIDILEDNVQQCRKRLYDIFDQQYVSLFKQDIKEQCRESIRYILARNILWGDALTLKTVGENQQPIVFSEWSMVKGSMVKRRDFAFRELLMYSEMHEQMSLFNKSRQLYFSDLGDDVFIPQPVTTYPLVHFLEVANAYE